MSFDTYFSVTSYALVIAAFAALVFTGEMGPISIGLYIGALVASIYMDAKGYRKLRPREWMWRVLTIAYIPFVFLDAALSNRLLALVHMTLFVSAVKLVQVKRERDWIFLYMIGFFQLALAASLTFNAVFVGTLIFYIFCFISALGAFEIRRTRREARVPMDEITFASNPKPRARRRAAAQDSSSRPATQPGKRSRISYFVIASAAELILVSGLTLPLFFLVPRVGGGAVASSLGQTEPITGFSDMVRLGDVASIKASAQIVMRVKLEGAANKPTRWRGIALDHYDGRVWTFTGRETIAAPGLKAAGLPAGTDLNGLSGTVIQTLEGEGPRPDSIESGTPPASFFPGVDSTLSTGGKPRGPASGGTSHQLLKQEFFLEPIGISSVFAARRLEKLHGPFRLLKVQQTRAVSIERRASRFAYTAWSDTSVPPESALRIDAENPPWIGPYLQLPTERRDGITLDPRIHQLAREVTRNAHDSYDRARAIEAYLKSNLGYTLNLKPSGPDPLAEFLFDYKEGHCEYFATAMVIMLRTIGIPARIVNGFQMGEFNDISNLYTVRERDAHSWVEVYFPKAQAWVEFDPTPSAGINDYSENTVAARIRKYMDAAEVLWMDYVVTLDRNQQASLIIGIQRRVLTLKDKVTAYYESGKDWAQSLTASLLVRRQWSPAAIFRTLAVATLAAALAISFWMFLMYRKLRRQPPDAYAPWWMRLLVLPTWNIGPWARNDSRASAVLFYQQMLSILSRRGIRKAPHQTPLEFAAANCDAGVMEITESYNRVRFGGVVLNKQEIRRIGALLDQLTRLKNLPAKSTTH